MYYLVYLKETDGPMEILPFNELLIYGKQLMHWNYIQVIMLYSEDRAKRI
jgi:hypothetical protein